MSMAIAARATTMSKTLKTLFLSSIEESRDCQRGTILGAAVPDCNEPDQARFLMKEDLRARRAARIGQH
jgi:hypothetical protein